jgi:hypothetical protein
MHNLNPLVILHIVAFVTLCEAYMGIDPHFDMWNYFFRARCRQYRDMELIIWGGGQVILIMSGHGIDPYFDIPMLKSMKGWQKKWFYLRNDANASLPRSLITAPFPSLTRGMGWPRKTSASSSPSSRSSNIYGRRGLWVCSSCSRSSKM